MKKKIVVILAAMILAVVCVLAGASAPVAPEKSAWILLPETAIYSQPTFEAEVLYTCNQNESVTLNGDTVTDGEGVVWQKVVYNNSVEGYLPYNLLYFTTGSTTEEVRMVKITPEKMGVTVPLYKVLTEEPALYLSDGTDVTLLETSADYGEYSLVEYEGQNYFVKTVNITDTLTYNQKVAVIIASVVIGLIVCIVFILVIYKKKALNK